METNTKPMLVNNAADFDEHVEICVPLRIDDKTGHFVPKHVNLLMDVLNLMEP